MLKILCRKLNLCALALALLLVAHGIFPSLALANGWSQVEGQSLIVQSLNVTGRFSESFPLLFAETVVEVPDVDEAAAAKEAEKVEAKKLKEAEKAAKKAAKEEAKRLEEAQETTEAAAKAEAKAAKKAAKEEAKKAKAAAKTAEKTAAEEQAIAPMVQPREQLAAATDTAAPSDFSTLTPEQKKQYFMSKKGSFKPTPEAIAEKVNKGMKMKGSAMPPGVSEKINAKMKGKEGFMPTPESISKKITDGMKMAQNKLEEVLDN